MRTIEKIYWSTIYELQDIIKDNTKIILTIVLLWDIISTSIYTFFVSIYKDISFLEAFWIAEWSPLFQKSYILFIVIKLLLTIYILFISNRNTKMFNLIYVAIYWLLLTWNIYNIILLYNIIY